MTGRDRGFAEFVETRGSALWRTASLLEIEPDDAKDLLAKALATTRRRWAALHREGATESATVRAIHETFVSGRRRDDSFDTKGDAAQGVSRERAALSSLTPRQRSLLVLRAYEGASEAEVARVLNMSVDDVRREDARAERAFRESAGGMAPSLPLLPALDAAALREVPNDLLEAAQSINPPRRGSLIAGGVIAAALLAVVVAVSPWPNDDDPSALASDVNEVGIPLELPDSSGLPTLRDGPIHSASTAYVVDGVVIVTDAMSGAARAVVGSKPRQSWLVPVSPYSSGHRGVAWTQVALSPDGAWLLLVQRRVTYYGSNSGILYLVNIATGEHSRLFDVTPHADATGVAGIVKSRLAWSPDSTFFACACRGGLSITHLDAPGRPVLTNRTGFLATAVAWGHRGLTVLRPQGGWVDYEDAHLSKNPFIYSDALAISGSEPDEYLTTSALTIYALGADKKPDGGRCTVWDSSFDQPTAVVPAEDREGSLCTPIASQWARNGFVLILAPYTLSEDEAQRLDISTVNSLGQSTLVGSFPEGTTTASIASGLVG